MSLSDLTRTIERAREGMERSIPIARKTELVTRRADDVLRREATRDGAAREAARRERRRLNSELGRRAARIGIAVGIVSLVTIVIGLIMPIGMFGFLAAVGIAIGIAAALALFPSGMSAASPPSTDLPNGQMVQRFDSYLYRTRSALPPPAQSEIDSLSAMLPSLKQTLERVDTLDPAAQDARRLMSIHLPGLLDRYLHVPADYRGTRDAEDLTVDERLIDGLAAGRAALAEIGETLARNDLRAFETQGRFIKSRYGEERIEG